MSAAALSAHERASVCSRVCKHVLGIIASAVDGFFYKRFALPAAELLWLSWSEVELAGTIWRPAIAFTNSDRGTCSVAWNFTSFIRFLLWQTQEVATNTQHKVPVLKGIGLLLPNSYWAATCVASDRSAAKSERRYISVIGQYTSIFIFCCAVTISMDFIARSWLRPRIFAGVMKSVRLVAWGVSPAKSPLHLTSHCLLSMPSITALRA